MTLLLAVCNSEQDEIAFVLEKNGYSYYILETVSNLKEISNNFQFALIDEDFNGSLTGWEIAHILRQTQKGIKIIMLVKQNPREGFVSLYDVTMSFPISEEELIGELRRT